LEVGRQPFQLAHHGRGGKQRILAQGHGRGAGMGGLPLQRGIQPANGLAAGDHANVQPGLFQNGPLLDMQFEIGIQRPPQRQAATVAGQAVATLMPNMSSTTWALASGSTPQTRPNPAWPVQNGCLADWSTPQSPAAWRW
jgi:hypothetical protein